MRPYLRVANVFEDRLDFSDVMEMNFTPDEFETYKLEFGDILLNEGQSPHLVGRPAMWRGEHSGMCFTNSLVRFRAYPGVEPAYALFVFRTQLHMQRYMKIAKITTNIAHLGVKRFAKVEFPLAPLPEQHRIVAEIEKHFTRLDAAGATLKRVKANLARARASVLKAAVEGRLVPTEAAQATVEGRDYEHASVLLKRILAERRRRHDEAQAGVARKKKYKEPVKPDLEGLPALPEGWVWATVDQVLENHDAARVPVKRADRALRHGPFSYYGASGVIDSIDDYTHEGTFVLVGEDGANLLSRSTPIAFIARGRFWVNNHAHVLQPYSGMPHRYFTTHFNAINLAPYVTGSAQPKLPQRSMNKIPFALPPLTEQHRIVAEVDRRLSVLDALVHTVDTNLARCSRLRQSILKRAFEGKLVPQNPDDEPASALLARSKAQAG